MGESRICSECGKVMFAGYCIEQGEAYYCSDSCLHKHMTQEEYLQLYDEGNGESYYTEWDEDLAHIISLKGASEKLCKETLI